MATVQKIDSMQIPLKTGDDLPHKVCAYCRVSTDDTDQKNSLECQKMFFQKFLHNRPNWTNIGIFADEGISGTSLDKRDSFNEMLNLARRGGVEIILTKEVSRFSRNVQHLLNIVEELRSIGVYIWFLSDDINTEHNRYREQLTQVATNAEQESLRTSRRVRWGQQQRMEQGAVFGRKSMFGYRIENGIFTIVPEEAEIVRNVFHWYASGDGTYTIAKRLQKMGVKTDSYKNGWSSTVILRLLRNEKYVGDLAQGKTYTPNPLSHKKKYNRGESVRYYITDHHPESKIIDRELWNRVQTALKEHESCNEEKAIYANRRWATGKIFCGACGQKYISITKKLKNNPYKAWVCYNNHQNGKPHRILSDTGETLLLGCTGKRVNDRVLKFALYDILSIIIYPQKEHICKSIYEKVIENLQYKENVDNIAAKKKKLEKIETAIATLTDRFVQGIIPESAYSVIAKRYDDEISELNDIISLQRNKSDTNENNGELYLKYMNLINEVVSLRYCDIEELYARILKRIVVHPAQILEIHLAFSSAPILLHYKTEGRGVNFRAVFEVIRPKNQMMLSGEC